MAYVFRGVITPDLTEKDWLGIEATIPFSIKSFKRPFGGSAAIFAENHDFESANEADERDWSDPASNPLRLWSVGNPEARFIWYQLECGGGDCAERGFAMEAGKVLAATTDWVEMPVHPDADYQSEFQKLIAVIGLSIPSPYFELFDRSV